MPFLVFNLTSHKINALITASALSLLMSITPITASHANAQTMQTMQMLGTPLNPSTLPNIPTPVVSISDLAFIPTVLINQSTTGNAQIDVSLLDEFLADVEPNVRHYPPNFPNRSQQYHTSQTIKAYATWIAQFADAPNASYDVLMRAAKLNGMARNLDMGSDHAVAASNYVAKAIKLKPNDVDANLLYGILLSEGGAYKQGKKYLDIAANQGSVEAEQTMAQAEIMADNVSAGLQRLHRLQKKHPNNAQIAQQIAIVDAGEFRIWDIPAPDINVKPIN